MLLWDETETVCDDPLGGTLKGKGRGRSGLTLFFCILLSVNSSSASRSHFHLPLEVHAEGKGNRKKVGKKGKEREGRRRHMVEDSRILRLT